MLQQKAVVLQHRERAGGEDDIGQDDRRRVVADA
jgi:hypothetical protein